MEVVLAQPRGFCAGVDRAIEIVERALKAYGAPIYVRHEIVHNTYVVDDLRRKGAVFVNELDEVPGGGTVVFSAHGVSKAVQAEAEQRGLRVFDATCPLVTKVHVEVAKMHARGLRDRDDRPRRAIPKSKGRWASSTAACTWSRRSMMSRAWRCAIPTRLAYVTQTTLSVDDAAAVSPRSSSASRRSPSRRRHDICYATQNRQDAVKFMAPQVDIVIVVGSPNSSNSNRLREVAERFGVPAYMVDTAAQLDPAWFEASAASASPRGRRRRRCWCEE